jgi:MFS family permease
VKRRELAVLLAVFVAVASASVGAGLARLALARYLRYDLGTSVLVASSLTSWFMVFRAVSSLVTGVIVDAWPSASRLFLPLPLALIALIVYTESLVTDPFTALVLNGLWGLLGGMVWPLAQTTTSLLARSWSNTAMSIYFAMGFLGVTLGQALYGFLPFFNAGVLRVSALFFLVAAGFMVVAVSYAPAAIRSGRGRRRGKKLRETVMGETVMLLLVVAFVAGFASGLLREFLYIYLGEVYGLSRRGLASVLAVAGVASFAAGLGIGPLADRVGVSRALVLILLTGAVGGVLLASPELLAAFTGIVLMNMATRGSLPLTRNAVLLGASASLVALSNTLNNAGQVISPIIAGYLYEHAACEITPLIHLYCKGSPYLLSSVLMILVVVIYAVLRRKRS